MPYDRPPLSKEYLAGTRTLDDIALRPPGWYDEHQIELMTHTPVSTIRTDTGSVQLESGAEISADRIVLATGGQAARPPLPGVEDHRVHVLRTSDDADRLRDSLTAGKRLLVVGGGLIGAEVASTGLGLGLEVTLVDPIAAPLGHVVGGELASILHDLHRQRGVETLTAGVTLLKDQGSAITTELTDGSVVEADVVLLGVGMRPETSLAHSAGLDTDRGVVVDPSMTTSNPHVLAIGDPIRVRSGTRLDPPAEHWDAAIQQAERAAATILDQDPAQDQPSWFWTDRHERHVEVVGHLADHDLLAMRGDPTSTSWSAFGFRGGELVGAMAVNDSNAVRAAKRMIERSVRVEPSQLSDLSTDLRKLVRG